MVPFVTFIAWASIRRWAFLIISAAKFCQAYASFTLRQETFAGALSRAPLLAGIFLDRVFVISCLQGRKSRGVGSVPPSPPLCASASPVYALLTGFR